MRFVEETGGSWTAEQLRVAEAEIEQQKREWEANRLAALKKAEEDAKRAEEEENDLLTYSREDAKNQVNNKSLKRKPVNRRLLSIKRGSSMNKNRNRRRMGMQAKREQTFSTRRVLRNNQSVAVVTPTKPEPSSNTSSIKASDNRRPMANVKRSVSTSPKKNEQLCAKRARRSEPKMNVSSDDEDEEAASDNDQMKNNHASTNGSDCGGGDSDQPKSEEFNDSECSLDVMVDSTDPPDSDDSAQSTYSTSSEDEDGDDEDGNGNDDDDDDDVDGTDMEHEHSKENLNSTTVSDVGGPIDVNSPRTRSAGRVKINLWTLDVSQILPELRAKRTRGKNSSGNNLDASTTSMDGDGDDDEQEHDGDEHHRDDNAMENDEQNDNSALNNKLKKTDSDNCDSSSVDSNKLKAAIRPAKILDGFQNSVSTNLASLASKAKKCAKIDKNVLKSNSGKNHNTLDKWISIKSPKIILNKSDCIQPVNNQAAAKRKSPELKRKRSSAAAAMANNSKKHSDLDPS